MERSKLATIAFSGSFIGTVISMPLSGVIANSWGWEAIFYIFGKKQRVCYLMKPQIWLRNYILVQYCAGAVGLAWCLLWLVFVKESPRQDPYITNEELNYIETSIGTPHDSVRIYDLSSSRFILLLAGLL